MKVPLLVIMWGYARLYDLISWECDSPPGSQQKSHFSLQVTAWSGLVFCALDQQSIVGWGSLSWTDPRLIFFA